MEDLTRQYDENDTKTVKCSHVSKYRPDTIWDDLLKGYKG